MTSEELLQSCLIHIKTQIDDRYSLAPVDMNSLKVLVNYIENESIPKEKIREKIKWYDEFLEKNKEKISKLNLYIIYSDKKEALQELLGE